MSTRKNKRFILLFIFYNRKNEEEDGSYVKYVEHGKDTILACDVNGSQIINSLHWTHKRKPDSMETVVGELNSVSKEQNYEVTSAFKAESFTLKVSNMTQHMQGDYTCYANNVSKSEYTLYIAGN